MRPTCLIVIPALNESATIADVVTRTRTAIDCPILVVSDASEDDTAQKARDAGAEVIELPSRLGAWGAIQTGLRWAWRHGYEQVLTLDADGQHPPDALPLLRAQLDHADVVIGTCPQRLSLAKRIAWAYFRLLTRLRVIDVTSGLRAYGAPALSLLARPEASLLDYQDIGVLMLLSGQGLRLEEVPVAMQPRQCGHSRVFSNWFQVSRYMTHTTVLCLARIKRRLPAGAAP